MMINASGGHRQVWVPQMFYPAGPPLMGAQLGRAQNFSEFLRSPRWPVCGHVSEGLICPPWLGPTREEADVKGDNLSTCSSGQRSGTLIEMKKKKKTEVYQWGCGELSKKIWSSVAGSVELVAHLCVVRPDIRLLSFAALPFLGWVSLGK